MYSVLIQNQKTMQRFQDYYPLFLEMISKGQLGLCRWVESGHSVDTALPGLTELVDGKEEWRAIIVRMEDESDMSSYPSVPGNVYDFLESQKYVVEENGKKKHVTCECKVPIVRLTQILGEVPAPELDFVPDVIRQEGKAPQRIFRTQKSEKDEKLYRELLKKYAFDGNKPDDIILVTFVEVEQKDERDNAEEAWITNVETDTSNFSRNNRYSSNTRFLQYPYVKEGRTKRNADLFNFWTCVMLLASGDMDPSSLQGFRLYTIHAEIEKDTLGKCLQEKYDELRGCKLFVENEIKADLEKRANEKHPVPDYKMNIPAKMVIPKDANITVDPSEFHLMPRSTQNDLNRWEGLSSVAEESLEDIFRRQDRILDESAMVMRRSCSMSEAEVTPLDKYEKQDMDAELSRTFDEILKTQNKVSGSRNIAGEKISGLSEAVRETIIGRITKPIALEIGAGLLLLVLVFFAAAFAFPKGSNQQYSTGVLAGLIAFALMLIACETFVLLWHRRKLTSGIGKFNEAMEENLNVLTSDLSIYSKFVSNIVSFSRGKSFLNTLRHKKFDLELDYEHLQRHYSEIEVMMDKVAKWAAAYYVPVSQNRNIESEHLVDIDIRPRDNRLYTLEYNKEYDIPLNYSGNTVRSPFSYIERLVIKREELYEK